MLTKPVAFAPKEGRVACWAAVVPSERSATDSVAGSAAVAAIGFGADLTTARPRRLAGKPAAGSATDVITFHPRLRPGFTLMRPADDQLARRRRTLSGLQPQSRASAAALVSILPLPAIHVRASSSERVRSGKMFVSDVAVAPTIKVAPNYSRQHAARPRIYYAIRSFKKA